MIQTRQPGQARTTAADVLDAIGNKPLVGLEGIYCKLEYLNPSGSVKARTAKYMIEHAEGEGLLRHGDTIVGANEPVEEMRRLAKEHGLFVGPSSGANLIAARKVRESHPEIEHVVTLFCDEGEKYISGHFGSAKGGRGATK